MPTPKRLKAPFYPSCIYHLVLKSIDGLLLFKNNNDYHQFKIRFTKFLSPFVNVVAYSLLPNHTHYIIKIKNQQLLINNSKLIADDKKTVAMKHWIDNNYNEDLFDAVLERQFNSFMVSYVKYMYFNYSYIGGLFQKPFKRILVTNEGYIQKAIIYVNANYQKHHYKNNFQEHIHNGFYDFTNNIFDYIDKCSIIDIFTTDKNFIITHINQVNYYYSNKWDDSAIE